MGTPSVRVSAARDMLDFVDRFSPGARRAVLSRFPPESLEALEQSARSSWLPIEHDHWVVDGIVEVLGRERAIECWRDSVPDLVDKPLLRSFVSGMLRIFGRDPARIIGLFPRAWPLVYRDFCTMRLADSAQGRAVLLFEDLAPELRRYPNYFASWHGACEGFAHLAKVHGKVEFSVAGDFSKAEARFSWD